MSAPIDVSVIIPSRARPQRLQACLTGIARQRLHRPDAGACSLEVVVAIDGHCPATTRFLERGGHDWPFPLHVVECERLGVAHAKNRALERSAGRIALFLNDDVLPTPGLVAAHLDTHRRAAGDPRWPNGVSVVGHSPWLVRNNDPALIRMLRDTSIVFFYHRMIDRNGHPARPWDHDWGFRHAWTLNYSAPMDALRSVAGYRPALANCCYEDIELAYRLRERLAIPVLFAPQALAPHDHPYTPQGCLEREYRLGYAAWGFAKAAPDCARGVFARDLADPAEPARQLAILDADPQGVEDAASAFAAFSHLHAHVLDGHAGAAALACANAAYRIAKRAAFARGLVDAAEKREFDGLFPSHTAPPAEPDAWRNTPAHPQAA